DQRPAHGVDVLGRHTGAHRGETGELDLQQQVVAFALLGRRFADHVAAGHVGVVPVDQSTYVDDDGVTLDDRPAGRLVVRARRVLGPGGDDRVVARTVGAVTAHAVLQLHAD